jgi:hypothetical protein
MASTNAKTNHSRTSTAPLSASGPAGGSSPNDAKLLNYVRGNGPRIVAAASFAAARAGEQQHWGEMTEYLTIANNLSILCGLGQISTGVPPLVMAAAAGR